MIEIIKAESYLATITIKKTIMLSKDDYNDLKEGQLLDFNGALAVVDGKIKINATSLETVKGKSIIKTKKQLVNTTFTAINDVNKDKIRIKLNNILPKESEDKKEVKAYIINKDEKTLQPKCASRPLKK